MSTARTMLLSEKTIREIAELAASPTCYSIGAQFARTLYEAERNRLMDEIERLTPWARMGAWALETSREELADLSGGEVEDAAKGFGLLREVHVTEPCCDECRCAGYDDFPQECLRIRVPFTLPIPLPEKHEEKGSDHE